MGLELAKAVVTVRGDAGALRSDLEQGTKQAESSIASFASAATKILATIGFGIGLRSLLSEFNLAIAAAQEQELAMRKVEAVVRATGAAAGFTAKQLGEQASALQKVTTFGDEAIQESMAVLLTFRSVQGSVFKDATELALDLATVFQTDLKSSMLQLGKALEDPVRGITALRRSGVSFTEAQQEQIKALVETNQLYQAQTMILDEVRKQVGGVAREMATTNAGALQQQKNLLGDLREELGNNLLPIMVAFTGVQVGLQRVFNAVIEPLAIFVGDVVKLAASFPGLIEGAATMAIAITTITTALIAARVAAIALGTSVRKALIASGIGAILVAAGALIGAVVGSSLDEADEEIAALEAAADKAKKEANEVKRVIVKAPTATTAVDKQGEDARKALQKPAAQQVENQFRLVGFRELGKQIQEGMLRKANEELMEAQKQTLLLQQINDKLGDDVPVRNAVVGRGA